MFLVIVIVFVVLVSGCVTNNSYQATDDAEIKSTSGRAELIRKNMKASSNIEARVTGVQVGDQSDITKGGVKGGIK